MNNHIVFATHNKHKLSEIQQMLIDKYTLKDLNDINCFEEIPENEQTLLGNALAKAMHVKQNFGFNCFADDTGLEVEALGGAPGVYSARYAGLQKNSEDNMNKLLSDLNGIQNRKARFRTVIALVQGDETHFFEGEVQGTIIHEKLGTQGFGYDPIFVPDGQTMTFAQMSSTEKAKLSHRGKAVEKLLEFLNL